MPDAVTNLIPVLVQSIEIFSPFKLLSAGAAVAMPSVNPYRNNTAKTMRRGSLNWKKDFIECDFNTGKPNVESWCDLTDVKTQRND